MTTHPLTDFGTFTVQVRRPEGGEEAEMLHANRPDFERCDQSLLTYPDPTILPHIVHAGQLYVSTQARQFGWPKYHDPDDTFPYDRDLKAQWDTDTCVVIKSDDGTRTQSKLRFPMPPRATSYVVRTRPRIVTEDGHTYDANVLPDVVTCYIEPLLLLPHEARALIAACHPGHPLLAALDSADLVMFNRDAYCFQLVTETCRAVDRYGRDLTLPMPRPKLHHLPTAIPAALKAVAAAHPQVPINMLVELARALPTFLELPNDDTDPVITVWPQFVTRPSTFTAHDIALWQHFTPEAETIARAVDLASIHHLSKYAFESTDRAFREQLVPLVLALEAAFAAHVHAEITPHSPIKILGGHCISLVPRSQAPEDPAPGPQPTAPMSRPLPKILGDVPITAPNAQELKLT